jgi:hypothetical protein
MDNIRVTLAVHWEGRHLDGVRPLVEARTRLLPGVPVTHFVSAAYFARGGDIGAIVDTMLPAFESHDEVALHVPAWQSIRGSIHGPERTVITGPDPELVVEYPGITAQVDRGYTYPISAYGRPVIEAFIVTSKLLLRPLLLALATKRRLQVERMLRGIRAGHGMASDVFLASACATGFAYDASAMDAVWARTAAERAEAEAERGSEPFGPLWRAWTQLWGASAQTEPHLGNHGMRAGTGGAGINAGTQPFFIARCGAARLLELPLGAGVVPPTNPQHVAELIAGALDSPPGVPRILGLAIRQETAEGSLQALLNAEALRSPRLHWTTNVDLLASLLGMAAVPDPLRQSPLQALREQMFKRPPTSAPPLPLGSMVPVAPPVVVPPIQIPTIKT